MVDSTIGGVKAALSAREQDWRPPLLVRRPLGQRARELRRVMQLYVERFNRRDWDGVRQLISEDALLNVLDAFAGRLADAPYFSNWGRWSLPWRLAVGGVDGESEVVILQRGTDTWTPYSLVQLHLTEDHIDRIMDYAHCP